MKKNFLFGVIVCLILFNTGCGLDTFYYIVSPEQVGNMPQLEETSVDKKIFQFVTPLNEDSSGYVGTDVYYKIYTEKDLSIKEKNVLLDLAKDDGIGAAEKLIYNYKYRNLQFENVSNNIFVSASDKQKNVKIRLTSYYDIDEYKASIRIDNIFQDAPVRYNGKSFDFGRNGNKNFPLLSDDDVSGSRLPSDNKFYVNLFAVATGHDAAYTNYFSNIIYLGAVTIDASVENN